MSAIDHASTCETCARALREAIEIFAVEEKVVPIDGNRRGANPALRWLGIAAALLMVVGLGYVARMRFRSPEPLVLLSQAYTEHRTLDLRLPGAAWGGMQLERGGEARKPTGAVEAELAFRKQLELTPNNPGALRAKGRWSILYGSPDDAIEALTAARDLTTGKTDAGLLVELAIAYRAKGRRNGQAADSLHAVEFLGQALQLEPENKEALFNRAVIGDELNLWSPAIADLEKLLSIEPSGPWSEEARKRLNEIRARHARFFDRSHAEDTARFDEAALDDSLQDLRGPGVQALAERLNSGHQDSWLRDLLSAPGGVAIRKAEETLGTMAQIRLTADTGRYQRERDSFSELYRTPLPRPLEAWRDFEALYRATHARGEFHCADLDSAAAARAQRGEYKWLLIQEARERASCRIQAGENEIAEKLAKQSISQADDAGFAVSAVRSTGLTVAINWRRGVYRGAINLAAATLERIFRELQPMARSQEFYNLTMLAAEDLAWWHAAQTISAQMTEAAEAADFRDLRFTNTVHLAQLNLRNGERAEARRLFQNALAYYAQSKSPRTAIRAWAEVGFADASGDGSSLAPFEQDLEDSPDPLVWVPYERVRATLSLRGGQMAEAHRHLDRISAWLVSAEATRPAGSRQWLGELRQAREVALDLLLREGRTGDAFRLLQQWKEIEEGAGREASVASHAADDNALWFGFARVRGRLAVWRAEGMRIDFRWATKPAGEVQRLTRQLARLLESPRGNLAEIDGVANTVAEVLFGSWLTELTPNRSVVFQGDDTVAGLAFAVLPVRNSRLGLAHPVSVTPLAFPSRPANTPPPPPAGNFLLVDASAGNSKWAADLPALPSAAAEIENIRNAIAGTVEVTSRSETLAAFGRAGIPSRLLHFAGHAVKTGDGVAFVFPDAAEPVTVKDLLARGFRVPPTVVLSACATGRRTLEDTAAPDSLAAAFLVEGSAEIIASLWDVDSDATTELMTGFYRNLSGGSGKALQAAMAALAKSGRFSHPHYWAMFTRFIHV